MVKMQPEHLSPCLYEPFTDPYCEPHKFASHLHTLFI